MKTILVPTDFSEVAKNALDYAIEIAKIAKAKIILFHAYQVPVIPSEIPVIIPADEMEKDAIESLKKIEKSIHLKHGNKIETEIKAKYGFPIDEINLFAKKNNVDLIVMGMEGSDFLTEKLIGNITTALIKKAKYPVLAVDKQVKFKSIKKIALACDYAETNDKSILTPLKEFAHVFKSHIYILNIAQELETVTTINKAVEGKKLNHLLASIDHSFHYAMNEDVIEGINNFVDKMKIDMVVMIPRMHTAIHNLFHEANTKKMAFHTKVPLLALHE